MTLQMNEMGLFVNGYKIVAVYKKFEKLWDGRWTCSTATCYQNGDECVIKIDGYTLYYDNKNLANRKIKHLISIWYKKEEK